MNTTNSKDCRAVPPKPTWRNLVRKLTNSYYKPMDVPPLPEDFKDGIVCHSEVSLSFPDRLRALVGMRISVKTITFTENLVGNTQSQAHTTVYLP